MSRAARNHSNVTKADIQLGSTQSKTEKTKPLKRP